MARKLTAANLFDTLEVDLFGNVYTMRNITRSISRQLEEAQKAVDDLLDDPDVNNDKLVDALLHMLGVMLTPVDGPGVHDLLYPMWESDELGIDWLQGFVEALGEEAANRRRPTSAPKTGR